MFISKCELSAFAACLKNEDRSSGTVEKYLHDASVFAAWLGCRELTRETSAAWRDHLLREGYAPATINSMLSAVNALFRFLGREDCKIKFLRVQRKAFREQSRELTRTEYQKLLDTAAGQGQERLRLLMETICATGIRVSEVQYMLDRLHRQTSGNAGTAKPEAKTRSFRVMLARLPDSFASEMQGKEGFNNYEKTQQDRIHHPVPGALPGYGVPRVRGFFLGASRRDR